MVEPSQSARPMVSVIVPHYHDLPGLELALSSLLVQTYPRALYEIIVADNDSPEGAGQVGAVVGDRAKLVLVPERGAGPARNGAVSHARGEVLAFIDSDCVADPDWIEQGVAALGRFDFAGGRVRVSSLDPAHKTAVEALETVFAFNFKNYIEKKGFSGSGNLFAPRAVFDKVGGFRVGVSEDIDWSHRATAAGFTLGYAPDAIVWHPARRTWTDLRTKWRRVHSETFHLGRGRPGAGLKWLARSLALPASAVAHTPKVMANRDLTSRERVRALGMLYRLRLWRLIDSFSLMFPSDSRRL